MPTLSVNQPIVGESSGFVEFVVKLDAPSLSVVTVDYSTSSGTASVFGDDFATLFGSLTFAAGVTRQTVRVALVNDTITEPIQSFNLGLFRAVGATIANSNATATIVDNDPLIKPTTTDKANLSVRDVVVDRKAGTASFYVLLDRAVDSSFSVGYSTASGTAVAGTDFAAASGTVTFGAGETVKAVTLDILNRGVAKDNSLFSLNLGALSGTGSSVVQVADGVGIGLIGRSNQATVTSPTISSQNVMASEADGYVNFVVQLSAPSASAVTVDYSTSSGTTSVFGDDFATLFGSLTFAAGVTTQTVRVALVNDTVTEPIESFNLGLFRAVGATIANSFVTATIVDGSPTTVNQLSGSALSDVITSTAANEIGNLGAGIDTVVYVGQKSDYSVFIFEGTAHVNDFVFARNGVDTFTNVERLQFQDTKLALDLGGNAGQVAKILGSVFGAAAVGNKEYVGIGLGYLDAGMSYADLNQLAIDARLGGRASNADVVKLLYKNVVGIDPSASALALYKGLLDDGTYTQGSLGVLAADTSENAININLVGLALNGIEFL